MTNPAGQTVLVKEININSYLQTIEIPRSRFAKGIYTIRISSKKGMDQVITLSLL